MNLHKRFSFFLCIAVVFLLSGTVSCTFHNEEVLYPNTECDTAQTVVYNGFVKETLERHCLSCHAAAVNEGGVNLEGYDQAKLWAESGILLSAISWDGNASQMPNGQDQLPQCTIDKIAKWIREATPEN